MKELSEQIVRDLSERGFAFMPIDINLYESAESGARIFLRAQSVNWRDWNFERDDNTELGIVEEMSSGARTMRDRNLALSFAHDLSRRRPADDPHIKACLGAVTNLYRDMRRRVSDFCFELDRHCGTNDVTGRVRHTFELGNERATTLQLRSSVCGRRMISGDVLQAESVLSFYFANEENEIWLKDETTGKWGLRSPPYGSALMFFGTKVGELENPNFKPMSYRIEPHSGKSIHASILHVQIKEQTLVENDETNVQPLVAS